MTKKLHNSSKRNIFFCSILFLISLVFFVSNNSAQTPEQVKYYSERIEFGTEDVKRNALFDLRNFKTESASRIALPALKDSSEIVRATATHSVIYLPKDESAQNLLPLLTEKSEFVRREATYALGKTRNSNVANELIVLYLKDKKQSVRDAAAVSLGMVGNPIAINSLLKVLSKKPKKKQNFYRRATARSIGQIAETIQRQQLTFSTPQNFLPDFYKRISGVSYQDLTQTIEDFRTANPILTKLLQNKKEFPDVKRESAFALGAIGNPNAISILKLNLQNDDYYLTEISKEALLKLENRKNVLDSK